MKTKMFEIRDLATTIPVIAIKTQGDTLGEYAHFKRSGWGNNSIILIKHNGEVIANYDPFIWIENGTRTLFEAHKYIEQHFDELENFAVIDIEFILGETKTKKESEII